MYFCLWSCDLRQHQHKELSAAVVWIMIRENIISSIIGRIEWRDSSHFFFETHNQVFFEQVHEVADIEVDNKQTFFHSPFSFCNEICVNWRHWSNDRRCSRHASLMNLHSMCILRWSPLFLTLPSSTLFSFPFAVLFKVNFETGNKSESRESWRTLLWVCFLCFLEGEGTDNAFSVLGTIQFEVDFESETSSSTSLFLSSSSLSQSLSVLESNVKTSSLLMMIVLSSQDKILTGSQKKKKQRVNLHLFLLSNCRSRSRKEVEKRENLRIDKKEDWREEGYDRNSTHELPSPLMVLSLKKTREKRGRERGRETPDIHLSFSISPDFCCFSLPFSLL